MKNHLREVQQRLSKLSAAIASSEAARAKAYMNSKLKFLGLRVPVQRAAYKMPYSFTAEMVDKQLKTWDFIWKNSDCAEVMSQALLFTEIEKKKNPEKLWATIKSWADRVENWGHADSLASTYSYLLEVKPKLVLPQLKRWNKDAYSWKRRLSLVSLLYYSQLRKKVLPYSVLESFVRPLLRDSDMYVQKGVGWTLREMHNVYPRQTSAFIRKHCLRLSTIAFTSSTEKWSKAEKAPLLRDRKIKRQSP